MQNAKLISLFAETEMRVSKTQEARGNEEMAKEALIMELAKNNQFWCLSVNMQRARNYVASVKRSNNERNE